MTTRMIPRITFDVRQEANKNLGYLGQVLVDGVNVFACGGTYGRCSVLASTDAGYTFVPRTVPPTSGLRRMTRIEGMLTICGEYGLLAVSDDAALTWTPITMPTEQCLFQATADHEGTRWVVGDGGFVARAPRGTWDFTQVDSGTRTRFLGIARVDERLFLLGFDGALYERKGDTFEPICKLGKAITALAVTPSGAWLVTCDGGGLFRSDDAGRTFSKVAQAEGDLEHVMVDDRGVFVVGSQGTFLFSSDEGKTFASIPTSTETHLWCITRVGNGYLVSADHSALFAVTMPANETMEATIMATPVAVDTQAAAAEEEDDEDEDSDEDDDEDSEDGEEEDAEANGGGAVQFASVEEASARWKKEGRAFMDALNGYVDRIYTVGINKAGKEPSETREDMAAYVATQLAELNAKGEHKKARELFPPAYEPFNYNALGRSVTQLAIIDDARTLVQVDADVFLLENDRITPLEGVNYFARTADRRLVGLGYSDRIDVHEGFGGNKVRSIPTHGVEVANNAQLTPEGDACLISLDAGVFWVNEKGARRLMPEDEDRSPSYIHGALSPNGRFVAIGCQDSSHILIDRKSGRRHTFDTVSSYPHFAYFHEQKPEVIFNSVHGLYGSGSLAVSIDALTAGKGEHARVLDKRAWVFSAASYGDGYLLADRGGYVWYVDAEGERKWYVFVGSSLPSLDISRDQKTLVIGSIAGYVIKVDLAAAARDPMLLTNGNVQERARWVFWRGFDPMIW